MKSLARYRPISVLWVLVCACGALSAAGAVNPVLPGVADAGVLRFNGHYYLMGVHTDGALWRSPDLVHWDGPFHAFSMDNAWATGRAGADSEIHACDLVLYKGRFHLYWSVNYRLLRAIGHAVSDSVLGPYAELNREEPFDGRIDPQLFIDDDGACYFYTVKFTDGNVIYGQPMAGPSELAGEARPLLSAVPDTWEFMDHKVNEAPFVVRYRDRYYMLYNGNHTGLEYGNYAIGCAVAAEPLGFNNDGKYPFYVLRDNWDRIHRNAQVLSPLSLSRGAAWKYTDAEPGAGWMLAGYDDGAWEEGLGSFGNQRVFMLGGTLRSNWDTEGIWLRRRFRWENILEEGDLHVLINHDADAEVFINGVKACSVTGFSGGYKVLPVSEEARQALQTGDNVLAVHCAHDGAGAQYIDAGLYLFKPGTAEPVILNCGQPTLVRGPNGFEWWLVYFAVYGGDPRRGQAIDRVHFFDRELFVEGPGSTASPGTWRLPSRPTFVDDFSEDTLHTVWSPGTGQWGVEEGALVQDNTSGLHRAQMDVPQYTHYVFETGLRFLGEDSGQIGIIAWECAPEQALYVGLDREANTWFWAHRNEFVIRTEVFNLPVDFNWDGWHMLRLEKNGPIFRLFIDGIPAPGDHDISVPEAAGPGRPGLVTRDGRAAYGSVMLTAGWDEYDGYISGWGEALDGTAVAGDWEVDEKGLYVGAHEQEAQSFKGDLLDEYEFNVQVLPEKPGLKAEYGVYGWYQDRQNHVRVALDANMTHLVVLHRVAGYPFPEHIVPLSLRERRASFPEDTGLNLRVVCVDDSLVIYVDGREVIQLTGDWPPAQVGLFAKQTGCRFNGLTLFDRSGDPYNAL